MSNIVTVKCIHFYSDWTDTREVEINIDKYVFFSIEYRGKRSWHIRGHWCDKNDKWQCEELSDHRVSSAFGLADFIAKVNSYEPKRCRVSRFNNLHYLDSFYSELGELLKLVAEKEKALKVS